eukprot:974513-Pleurochrysis_carterae.AAC.1
MPIPWSGREPAQGGFSHVDSDATAVIARKDLSSTGRHARLVGPTGGSDSDREAEERRHEPHACVRRSD